MALIRVGAGPGQPSAGFETIQAAIDAAQPGDTIVVPTGVYKEEIIIRKPLTLLGAGAYRDPVEGGRTGGESVLESAHTVTIKANGVTLNGFEIRNYNRYAICIPTEAFVAPDFLIQNITLNYNWIHTEDGMYGIVAEPGVLQNLSITNNIIHLDNPVILLAQAAILLNRGTADKAVYENLDISQNDINNHLTMYSIWAYADPDTYQINGMVMRANRFRNSTSYNNVKVGNICNGQFIDNVVEDCRVLLGMQFGSVIGNTFTSGGRLVLLGINDSSRPSCHVSVTNNNLTDEVFGNGLWIWQGALAYTIPVHNNAFRDSGITPSPPPDYSTGYLIRNDGLGTLYATDNWWGSADGPAGNTGGIAGSVTTSPWIKLYTDDPAKQTPPATWPLSAFMTAQPGFWPIYPTGVSYIGKTCFSAGECLVLLALVSYVGGDGSGYVVEFDFNVLHLISQTLAGGVAYVCLGTQIPAGVYDLTVRLGPYSSVPVKIKVGGCGGENE